MHTETEGLSFEQNRFTSQIGGGLSLIDSAIVKSICACSIIFGPDSVNWRKLPQNPQRHFVWCSRKVSCLKTAQETFVRSRTAKTGDVRVSAEATRSLVGSESDERNLSYLICRMNMTAQIRFGKAAKFGMKLACLFRCTMRKENGATILTSAMQKGLCRPRRSFSMCYLSSSFDLVRT